LGKDVGLDCTHTGHKSLKYQQMHNLTIISCCMFRLNFLFVWNALADNFLVHSTQTGHNVLHVTRQDPI